MRAVSDELYAIPRERVVGSSAALEFRTGPNGTSIHLMPAVDVIDDGPQKPIRIWSRTGRGPLVAAGKFAYDAGAEKALATAATDDWTVVSMRDDWTRIFPDA